MLNKTSEVAQKDNLHWLKPNWPAPEWVIAGVSSRIGGVSRVPFNGLNLAGHVGDDPDAVQTNRRLFIQAVNLPNNFVWLNQIHGNRVVNSMECHSGVDADGIYTKEQDQVCLVLTADCLPVLLTDEQGSMVAAVHAGWRGLVDGVLEQAVSTFPGKAQRLLAWLGPAISAQHYEVGDDVVDRFLAKDPLFGEGFVKNKTNHRYHADMVTLARITFRQLGVERIYGGDICTFKDQHRFYSYRRDATTGRFGSFIYLHRDTCA